MGRRGEGSHRKGRSALRQQRGLRADEEREAVRRVFAAAGGLSLDLFVSLSFSSPFFQSLRRPFRCAACRGSCARACTYELKDVICGLMIRVAAPRIPNRRIFIPINKTFLIYKFYFYEKFSLSKFFLKIKVNFLKK